MLKKAFDAEIIGRDYRVIPTEVPDMYKIKRIYWDEGYGCNIETFFHVHAQRVSHTRADIIKEAEEFLLYGEGDY